MLTEFIYTRVYVDPKQLIYSSPSCCRLVTICSLSESHFYISLLVSYMRFHMAVSSAGVCPSLSDQHLSMITCMCTHVAEDGIILSFFMAE